MKSTKRLISVLLSAVMLVCTMQIGIIAAEETEIDIVEITDYVFPCHGEKKLLTAANTADEGYSVTKIIYQSGDTAVEAPLNEGDVITVIFDVKCNEGYKFAPDVKAVIGDSTSKAAVAAEDNTCRFSFEHTVVINPDKVLKKAEFDVGDFILTTLHPKTFVSITTGIEAGNITWEPKDETIEEDKIYSGTATIKGVDGYTYNPKTLVVTVNGKIAKIATKGSADYIKFELAGQDASKVKKKVQASSEEEKAVEKSETKDTPDAMQTKAEEYIFPFEDVSAEDWFRNDVEIANKNGLVSGKSDTIYAPYDNMTYAEAVKLAACMYQLYYNGKVSLGNGTDEWYSTYMAFCLKKGIISEDLSAKADESINRSNFVKIFYASLPSSRFANKINDVKDNAIPDVKKDDFAAKEIYAFYRAGILTGNDEFGTFNPSSNINRAEVAAILTRMFDMTARKKI